MRLTAQQIFRHTNPSMISAISISLMSVFIHIYREYEWWWDFKREIKFIIRNTQSMNIIPPNPPFTMANHSPLAWTRARVYSIAYPVQRISTHCRLPNVPMPAQQYSQCLHSISICTLHMRVGYIYIWFFFFVCPENVWSSQLWWWKD